MMPTLSLRPAQAVLFDLDGTLLDSRTSHYRVYQHVFADLGIQFDHAVFTRYYSPNWYLLYERIGLPRDRWPEADQLWLRHYEQETPGPRTGAGQVLAVVKGSRRALGLVTSGERARVERDLDRLGWVALFDAVVCGGDAPRMKPHPDPLRLALSQLNLSPRAAVYVGDTIEDVQMGKAAGTATVALAGGFSSHETLSGERPDILLDSLDELIPLMILTASP